MGSKISKKWEEPEETSFPALVMHVLTSKYGMKAPP